MSAPRAYYNEHDPFAAQWLRNLIAAGHIAPGDVDDRDIQQVQPADLTGYTQCHFFAGIGGWSLACRLARWGDDEPIWTGSCPCQPFSDAGKRGGTTDARHLWPEFHRLIAQCRPPVVVGEPVASQAGGLWLAGVRADLEGSGYRVGAADLCAAGVSAPHVRQRLYWVADADGAGCAGAGSAQPEERDGETLASPRSESNTGGLANARGQRRQQVPGGTSRDEATDGRAGRDVCEPDGDHVVAGDGEGDHLGLGDTDRYHPQWWSGPLQMGWNAIAGQVTRGGRTYRAQWRVGPGLRLVAHGIPGRVGKLCGLGNAIVPQVAAEFIGAYMDVADFDA